MTKSSTRFTVLVSVVACLLVIILSPVLSIIVPLLAIAIPPVLLGLFLYLLLKGGDAGLDKTLHKIKREYMSLKRNVNTQAQTQTQTQTQTQAQAQAQAQAQTRKQAQNIGDREEILNKITRSYKTPKKSQNADTDERPHSKFRWDDSGAIICPAETIEVKPVMEDPPKKGDEEQETPLA